MTKLSIILATALLGCAAPARAARFSGALGPQSRVTEQNQFARQGCCTKFCVGNNPYTQTEVRRDLELEIRSEAELERYANNVDEARQQARACGTCYYVFAPLALFGVPALAWGICGCFYGCCGTWDDEKRSAISAATLTPICGITGISLFVCGGQMMGKADAMADSVAMLDSAYAHDYVRGKESGGSLLWVAALALLGVCGLVAVRTVCLKKTILDRFRPQDQMFVVDNNMGRSPATDEPLLAPAWERGAQATRGYLNPVLDQELSRGERGMRSADCSVVTHDDLESEEEFC